MKTQAKTAAQFLANSDIHYRSFANAIEESLDWECDTAEVAKHFETIMHHRVVTDFDDGSVLVSKTSHSKITGAVRTVHRHYTAKQAQSI